MQLVALTRWKIGSTLEQELPALAAGIGLGLYDARLKLSGPLPNVVGSGLDAAAARTLLGLLRSRGHGALECDSNQLLEPEQMRIARSVQLSEQALRGSDDQGRPFELPFVQLKASMRAFEQNDETQTITTKSKQLAVGRALLTGGLLLKKSVTKVETNESTERQFIAYLFGSAPGEPPLVLKETRLNYEGLGARRGVTAHDSFEKLIAFLRQVQPNALHDDRLLTQKRRSDRTSARGIATERVVSNSNAGANARAAQLILLAHRAGQL